LRNRKISLISLGCPKNLVDSEGIVSDLMTNSAEIVVDPAEADVVVVNTCGFLGSAREESLNTIREAAKLKKSGLKALFVTGCMVGNYRDQLIEAVPEVDRLIDFADYGRINEYVNEYLPAAELATPGFVTPGRYVQARLTPAHFSYLKIGEGCNHTCSFCVIPKIRGRLKSIPMEELVNRARRLGQMGTKEINVVAQDTTMYGVDLYGRFRITELLQNLDKIDELSWIRLLYAYPTEVTEDLADLLASGSRVLPYIDVPLQHSSNHMLELMRRKTREDDVELMIDRLRSRGRDMTIRTTMIVGFPGETDADFEHLMSFAERHQFDRLGAFTYSPEEGSQAFDLPGHVPEEVKEERLGRLMTLQQQISKSRNQRFVDQDIDVLIEDPGEGTETAIGRSKADAPEIDGKVFVRGKDLKSGDIVQVKINRAEAYDLHGRVSGDQQTC
jgi:ribosomal protein S12 methylthiotransferase